MAFQDKFIQWASHLKISSKDYGLVPLKLFNTQKYFIQEINRGFDEGKRAFVILKARQLGITTVSLALDLYWMFKYPHLPATLIVDSDANKEYFRALLRDYIHSLPKDKKYPLQNFTRNAIMFKNGSKLFFQTASKKNVGLGQGKGITLLHATEVSSYPNEDGFKSLLGSLSDKNKNRLYIYESTAKGFNLFYDLWSMAEQSAYYHAIFIGWWRKEEYQIAPTDPRFKAYAGNPTPEEKQMIKAIRKLYDVELQQSQLVWYRWKLEEEMFNDTLMMAQEYPSTPDEAFISTGSKFFSGEKLTHAYKNVKQHKPTKYRFMVGEFISQIKLVEDNRTPNFLVWEEPSGDGIYVVGVDTAYGVSENSDYSVIEVLRVFGDRVYQVAEFQDNKILPHQLAWVLASILGMYGNSYVNIEVNGSGYSVITELKNLKRGASLTGAIDKDYKNALSNVKQYIWTRPDSIMGLSSSYHWKTSSSTKRLMMDAFRDMFEVGLLEIRSIELLDQMRRIIDDGISIQGEGASHDDLVMAMAIACVYYRQHIQATLLSRKFLYKSEEDKAKEQAQFSNPYLSLLNQAKNQLKRR